ncbi:GTP-binding protein [Candidatus Woesearchaeota archaeon]|nr:GTP-binding protein [Candidatus Woesearchaeota archaeon]
MEDEMSKMQYNKRTQHHYGLLRAKVAALKEKEAARSSQGAKHEGYTVRKSGDASVILVGFPSAGKSSLLNVMTNANSPVGNYEFTTLSVVPGTMEYRDAKIQILDVPGIVTGAASGRGRGKEVLSVTQNADLVIILVDVLRPNAYDAILKEVFDSNIRVNKKRPDVRIKKTSKDGIRIGKTVKLDRLDDETIISICKEFRINNAEVLIRSQIDVDDFIDVVQGHRFYLPGITVLSKSDLVDAERLEEIRKDINADLCVSAEQDVNIDELKELIFERLSFIRIYCKEVGKKADMGVPLIMREGDNIHAMCNKLHKDFVTKFKFARVWGKSAKFPGQRLMMHHVLQDQDIVEIHLR